MRNLRQQTGPDPLAGPDPVGFHDAVNPYFVDVDGYGDVTLWRHNDAVPAAPHPIIAKFALPEDVWVAMLRGLGIRPEGEDE